MAEEHKDEGAGALGDIREALTAVFGRIYGGPSRRVRILTPKEGAEPYGVHVYIEDNFTVTSFRESAISEAFRDSQILQGYTVDVNTLTVTGSDTPRLYGDDGIEPGHIILIGEIKPLENGTPDALRAALEPLMKSVHADYEIIFDGCTAEAVGHTRDGVDYLFVDKVSEAAAAKKWDLSGSSLIQSYPGYHAADSFRLEFMSAPDF